MTNVADRRSRLEQVIAEFLSASDSGQAIEAQSWIDRYPDLQPELAEFISDQASFDRLVQPLRGAALAEPTHALAATPSTIPVGPEFPREWKAPPAVEREFGDYTLVREIGRGGMGVVFEAWQSSLDRRVALKMLRPGLLTSEEELQWLRREALSAAALDHAAIVPIYQVAEHAGVSYFTMKLIEGGTLVSEWRPLHDDPAAAARILLTLAEAVEHAHQRGVLHCDLKPANILMDTEGKPHITDFGLAHRLPCVAEPAQFSALAGTPAYMAPEQTTGQADVTTVTDVYGLGAILYSALTGQPPFRGDSVISTIEQVRSEPPESPSRWNEAVSPDLEAICLKSLAKQPEDRYASAGALEDDLQRFFDGAPVLARPLARIERWRRRIRRNPAMSALAASVLILVVTLSIGSSAAAVLLFRANAKTLDSLENEIQAKEAATRNEGLALQALYEARKAHARAARSSGQIGQHTATLDAIRHASRLIPRLGPDDDEKLALRNEAIAAMQLVDLEQDRLWPTGGYAHTDADVEQFVLSEPKNRFDTITIHSMQHGKPVADLALGGGFRRRRFSPDGRCVVAFDLAGEPFALEVWDVSRKKPILRVRDASRDAPARTFEFRPDGAAIAVFRSSGMLELYDLPSGERSCEIPCAGMKGAWFDPSGRRIAVYVNELRIIDAESSQTLNVLECPIKPRRLKWSPDGRSIAAMLNDEFLHLWDVDSGRERLLNSVEKTEVPDPQLGWSPDGRTIAATLGDHSLHLWETATGQERRLAGHSSRVIGFHFHPQRNLIATTSWDFTTRLWDAESGRQLLRIDGVASSNFSRDGQWLGYSTGTEIGRWRVVLPDGYRWAYQRLPAGSPTVAGGGTTHDQTAIHPDGKLLISGHGTRLAAWDLTSRRQLGQFAAPGSYPRFSPDGRQLFVASTHGEDIFVRSVERQDGDSESVYTIGPARRLRIRNDKAPEHIDAKPGVFGTVGHQHGKGRLLFYNMTDLSVAKLTAASRNHNNVDISADGRLLAVGHWHGPDVHVWEVPSGELIKTIFSRGTGADVRFNPEGTTLAVSESGRCSFYDVESWKLLHETAPGPAGNIPPPVAFAPDASMVACVTQLRRAFRVLETESFRELATFELPDDEIVKWIEFSPDGSQLVVFPAVATRIHFWDLRQIRVKLGNLDWDGQEFSGTRRGVSKPLRVTFDAHAD